MPYVKDKNGNWKWQDGIGGSAEDQAQRQYINAGQEFVEGGPVQYDWLGDVEYQQLGAAPLVGQSELANVTVDPRMRDAQLKALAAMEEKGTTGLSAADELALSQTSKKLASDERARQQTIEQNLARQGRAGGRLGVAMQMQSGAAAQEAAAQDAARRNVMAQEGRLNAQMGAANLAGQMGNEEYSRKANAAQANDAIAKFNNQNTIQRQQYNNGVQNQAIQQNWQGRQNTANANQQAAYDHRQNTMSVQQGAATYNRDKAVDEYNRAQAEKAAKAKKKAGIGSAIGGVVGGAAGAYFGGPAGATAGAGVGSALGGAFFAKGGRVPGVPQVPGDSYANDNVQVNVSPGEIILPRTVSNDPGAAAEFVAKENSKAIHPAVLAKLSATNPDLVEKYKVRMGLADEEVAAAQRQQDIGNYGNVVGKIAQDFANSQKDDVIYKNRTADMGRAPQIQEAERRDYDPSLVNSITAQGVNRAQQNRAQAESDFMTGEKLADLSQLRVDQEQARIDQAQVRDRQARMLDPNSDESVSAREYLKQVAPNASSMAGFEKLSAAQIEKVAPGLSQAYQAAEQRNAQAADRKAQREFQAGMRSDAKADRQAIRNEALAQKKVIEDDKAVERLGKAVSGVQDTANAIAKVEAKLGGKLEDFSNSDGVLKRNGKEVDLPGVSVKGLGRLDLWQNDAQELESAIGTVFNTELKDRSGAAVTNNEMERLKSEFGKGKFNTEAQMIQALKDYKAAMVQELKNREAAFRPEVKEIYKERGGQTSDDFQSVPSNPSQSKPAWAK